MFLNVTSVQEILVFIVWAVNLLEKVLNLRKETTESCSVRDEYAQNF